LAAGRACARVALAARSSRRLRLLGANEIRRRTLPRRRRLRTRRRSMVAVRDRLATFRRTCLSRRRHVLAAVLFPAEIAPAAFARARGRDIGRSRVLVFLRDEPELEPNREQTIRPD